jgi:hypothetical protein
MENLRVAGPPDFGLRLEDWPSERDTRANSRMPRVNLLLVGPDEAIEKILETVRPDIREPIAVWRRGERFLLPPATWRGTMILRDVEALGLEDQGRLLTWLERVAGQTQVVSTASAPLLSRIESGAFLDTLYYRLNTIYMDVSARPKGPWDC